MLNLIIFGIFLAGRVSSHAILKKGAQSYAQCPFTNAVETGRIKDPELKETSGLVASHKNYGVFYAIQDSLNPDPVYAINQEGDLLGKYFRNRLIRSAILRALLNFLYEKTNLHEVLFT